MARHRRGPAAQRSRNVTCPKLDARPTAHAARVVRPTIPQLLFAATTVAAVIAMPSDVLTGSTSTLSNTPITAGPAATSPAVANPAASNPAAAGPAAADPPRQPAAVAPIRQVDPPVDEQIAQAVRTSPLLGEVSPERIKVVDVHVSTVDPTVAAAHVVPTGGETDPAIALLRHGSSPGSHWTLVELGTAGVGCDTLRPAVRDDLGLICEDQPVG